MGCEIADFIAFKGFNKQTYRRRVPKADIGTNHHSAMSTTVNIILD